MNIFKGLLLVILSLLLITNTYAYTPSSSDKITINKLTNKIQKILDNNSLKYRGLLKNNINKIQNQYKKSKKIFYIFQEIKKNTHLIDNKEEYLKHYNEFNIDFKKVQKSWLNWHNKARKDLGRKSYSYDQRLDSTAYEWSIFQQNDGKMSHKREALDAFYDYHKVEKWFTDRGVKCVVAGGATTSESVGKFGYYCNDNECTDELLKSLKVIFDIYMAEKGLPYPANAHYKGIILPELTKIGLGINIKERFDDTYKDYRSYDYYLTTHYCTKFKK